MIEKELKPFTEKLLGLNVLWTLPLALSLLETSLIRGFSFVIGVLLSCWYFNEISRSVDRLVSNAINQEVQTGAQNSIRNYWKRYFILFVIMGCAGLFIPRFDMLIAGFGLISMRLSISLWHYLETVKEYFKKYKTFNRNGGNVS